MSRRTLGGGRILGSGKYLATTVADAIQTNPPSSIPAHVLSPAASTLSLDSTDGAITPESQDIVSRLSNDHGTRHFPLASSPAGDRLLCPICAEEMMTLLQLNRHIDDVHKDVEEKQQTEVRDWFSQQIVKARKFQPLTMLNQKWKGVDGFESNNDIVQIPAATKSDVTLSKETLSTSPAPRPVPMADPDEVVTKQHWQKKSTHDLCSEPACGKRLGPTGVGIVNCRHCGKLFCEEHTMYQMKLSRSAQHEPLRGIWGRVCETCYKSRPGYADRHGLERDRIAEFGGYRKQKTSQQEMEETRLEKRLTRLTQLLANPPEEPQSAVRKWSFSSWGQSDPRKTLEQTVVTWQDDASVQKCPYCQQEFSQYTFRRHHCRTCGKVVCGDPLTACSIVLPLTASTRKPPPNDTASFDIRLCKECNSTIFSRRDFQASLSSPQIDTFKRAYDNLLQFERGIRLLLPRFQKLLQALQDPDSPPTSTQIADASRTRKRLMDSFTQFDTAARRIRDMPSESATQMKLQKAIHQNASQFLHLHMLPMKTLPKVLKHATPQGDIRMSTSPAANGAKYPGALTAIRFNHVRKGSSSNLSISSITSSRISELEAEEKSLKDRLIVLEEQRFMVQEMVTDANKRRKFDEMAALARNVEDLSHEIDEVQKQLDGLDFEGAYTGLGSAVASPMIRPQQVPSIHIDAG